MGVRRLVAVSGLVLGLLAFSPGDALAVTPPLTYGIACQVAGGNCTPPLVYHGGKVQHHPRIYLIFWGQGWKTDPNTSTIVSAVQAMFLELPNTALNHILIQYNDSTGDYVHSDVYVSGTWIDTSTSLSGGISSASAVAEVQSALQTNGWTYDADTQFMIFPQNGAHGDPFPLSGNECGHHEMDALTRASSVVIDFIDYPDNSFCNSNGLGIPGQFTQGALHEYAEAATNPQLGSLNTGSGWYTNEPSGTWNLQEIGDLCNNVSDASNAIMGPYRVWPAMNTGPGQPGYIDTAMSGVQALYSNAAGSCTYWQGEDGFVPSGLPVHTVFPPMQAVYDAHAWGVGNTPFLPSLGYPVEEDHTVTGGFRQGFSNGAMYSYSGGTYELEGPIWGHYGALGDTASFLGWPASSQQYTPGAGGVENTFQNNACGSGSAILLANGSSSAYEMHGCIYRDYLGKYGGPQGRFGFPTSDEQPTTSGDGRMNYMSGTSCGSAHGSALYWNGVTFGVGGCFFQAYKAQVPPETASALGYPASDEYNPTPSTVEQDFQRGYMLYDSAGVHVVLTGAKFAPTVTVLGSNTSTCPGNQQYFTATDHSGVAIDWTYANGSNQCVQVAYAPEMTTSNCTFSFYVPNGHATGVIYFRVGFLLNGNPHFTTYSLDENPVQGYQQLFNRANVFSVTFGDNNGQNYPTQLGWASGVDHGLLQTC
jgi:hypothetical protein